jgi:hypothetical protein
MGPERSGRLPGNWGCTGERCGTRWPARCRRSARYRNASDRNLGRRSPALSRDGRMLAFIRGPETFMGRGEIYVKFLPDGDAVQLTRDGVSKMSPAFDPGGTHIFYTAKDAGDEHGGT